MKRAGRYTCPCPLQVGHSYILQACAHLRATTHAPDIIIPPSAAPMAASVSQGAASVVQGCCYWPAGTADPAATAADSAIHAVHHSTVDATPAWLQASCSAVAEHRASKLGCTMRSSSSTHRNATVPSATNLQPADSSANSHSPHTPQEDTLRQAAAASGHASQAKHALTAVQVISPILTYQHRPMGQLADGEEDEDEDRPDCE